ncbi:MAG: gliding motility lipoprotein GldH [Bacteroidales bacterium]|nr:gliding motility lipoprotein GldH [Bacteroidales bacterium]
MKKTVLIWCCILCFFGCSQQADNTVLLHRDFFKTVWERFDFVKDNIEITAETSYDLSLKIVFTDDYPYNDISMVFTVFTGNGEPYRSKGYKFNLKDEEGKWNVERMNECYTFILPINKDFRIVDAGTYTFQIENRMPITPLVGVKELTLLRN